MLDTIMLLVTENARMRLHALRPELPEEDAHTLRELLFRLAQAPQEGALRGPEDGINHQHRNIAVSLRELRVLTDAAGRLRTQTRHVGELRIWDVLLDAVNDRRLMLTTTAATR